MVTCPHGASATRMKSAMANLPHADLPLSLLLQAGGCYIRMCTPVSLPVFVDFVIFCCI